MKKFLLLTAILVFGTLISSAQYGNFRKYQIAQTAHYCYFPADPGTFDEQKSEDGQLIYTGHVVVNNNTFGVITVLLNESFASNTKEELENLLVSYMDYLKGSFNVTGAVGYGHGHTLNSNPDAIGVLDYWENKDGEQLVVKGWVNKKAISYGCSLE
jgi:hypothetical protein